MQAQVRSTIYAYVHNANSKKGTVNKMTVRWFLPSESLGEFTQSVERVKVRGLAPASHRGHV